MNVMNDIAQKDNIQIGYYNRDSILRIFKVIDQLSPEVNIGRRRMISVNFILKQPFDILGKELYSSDSVKIYFKILQPVVGESLCLNQG